MDGLEVLVGAYGRTWIWGVFLFFSLGKRSVAVNVYELRLEYYRTIGLFWALYIKCSLCGM